jgi:hypothetical protein
MCRGLRSLGDSGLNPSSSSSPSSPSASASSGSNNPLGFTRARQAGPTESAFNTSIQPGILPQFINTPTTTSQTGPNLDVSATRQRYVGAIPQQGQSTSMQIQPRQRQRRAGKETPAMAYLRSLGEDFVDVPTEDELKNMRIERSKYAQSHVDPVKRDEAARKNLEIAHSMKTPEKHKEIMAIARSYRKDPIAIAADAPSHRKQENINKSMEIARSQKRDTLLRQLPPGAKEVAIEHNLTRDQVKLQVETIKKLDSKQSIQGSSTIQLPPKQDNPDAPDLDF